MKNRCLLDIVGEIDDRYIAEAAPAARKTRSKPAWRKWGAVAACIVLMVSVSVGAAAIAAEAKEYKAAVQFFNENGMSTEGLTREEIKAVYRDITTKSFTYSKTAGIILDSISSDYVGGYEIIQEHPTPEDIENLWYYKNYAGRFIVSEPEGDRYAYRYESIEDDSGIKAEDRYYIEKYDGERCIWSVPISEFLIKGCCTVADGVVAYGRNTGEPGERNVSARIIKLDPDGNLIWDQTLNHGSVPISEFLIEGCCTVSDGLVAYGRNTGEPGERNISARIIKLDPDGNLIWDQTLNHGFEDEYIAKIVEDTDGSYAVFSRGNLKYLCLSRYSSDGRQLFFSKSEIGNYGIRNAAKFGEGYLVQLMQGEQDKIVKVDHDGTITDSFCFDSEDAYYYITDMIEFNGKICLSAYAVPGPADQEEVPIVSHYELAAVKDALYCNGHFTEVTCEELTPLVRDNYTAMLLVCDPDTGTPQKFYSVRGSFGSRLSVNDRGELVWDVESIASAFWSPTTSSYTIDGTCHIFRYTFNDSGLLTAQEKTGETVYWRR